MFDVVGVDMPCMDLNVNTEFFPRAGSGESVKQLSWQGGNKVASGMVACARLGARSAMMGCVGDDIFGRFIIKDFERHDIDVSAMKVREAETTSLSIVLSDYHTGSRTIVYRSGTVPRYKLEDMDLGMLCKAKYFFISVVCDEVKKAIDIAREVGVQVFIDADGYSAETVAMLPKIDVFVGSEDFYTGMFNNDDFENNCRKIMAMGPRIVVFTLGEKGCVGVSDEGFFRLPAFSVDVADTVGAGDVFHGAFLVGLLKDKKVEDTARFASAAAAIKCTRIGGRAGIPDLKTLERFLEDGTIDYKEIDERVKFYERGLEHV
jgi:sugar/nucleoside kinase (ribokinase family)